VPLLVGLEQRARRSATAGSLFRLGWLFGFVFFVIGMHWIALLSEVAITVPWLKYPAWIVAAAYLALYSGLATLVGIVRREDGGPVGDATASVPGAPADAMSDSTGRFVLTDLPAGSHELLVRRIGYGYSVTLVELRNRDTTRVSLALRAVTILDEIRVTANQWVRGEVEELQHRLSHGSVGRVRNADDLRGAGSIRTVLFDFPSLTTRTQPGSYSVYMTRGTRACSPTIWVDGWRSDVGVLEAYRPADLIALEVYPPGEVPMRYQDFGSCGVVLAWTRYLR